MEVLFIAIPLTLMIVIAAVVLFLWAMKNGQFDDLDTPAHRALLEESPHSEQPISPPTPIPPQTIKK